MVTSETKRVSYAHYILHSGADSQSFNGHDGNANKSPLLRRTMKMAQHRRNRMRALCWGAHVYRQR